MAKRIPEFQCMECGKKFYSVNAAERATRNGCPKCNGVDIDIYVPKSYKPVDHKLDDLLRNYV